MKKNIIIGIFFLLSISLLSLSIYHLNNKKYKAEEILNSSITVNTNTVENNISEDLFGTGTIWSGSGGKIIKKTIDDEGRNGFGLDEFIVNATKNIQPKTLRFTADSVYNWRSGVGENYAQTQFDGYSSIRPKRYINATDTTFNSYDYGIEEFLWFADEVGAKPIIPISSIYGLDERVLNNVRMDETCDNESNPLVCEKWSWEDVIENSQRAVQSASNLVEFLNGEFKQEYINNNWQPTYILLGDEPNRIEEKFEDKENPELIHSWYSWEKAPEGYFAWLRWYFAQKRMERGETYNIDKDPQTSELTYSGRAYNVELFEIGNEEYIKGPTRLNKMYAQPKFASTQIVNISNAMKQIDPSIKIGASAWLPNTQNYPWNEAYRWNGGTNKISIDTISRNSTGKVTVKTKTAHGFKNKNVVDLKGLPQSSLNTNSDDFYEIEVIGELKNSNTFTFNSKNTQPIEESSGDQDSYAYSPGLFGPSATISKIITGESTKIVLTDLKGLSFGIGDIISFSQLPTEISYLNNLDSSDRKIIGITTENDNSIIELYFNSFDKVSMYVSTGTISIPSPAFQAIDLLNVHKYVAPYCKAKNNETCQRCDTMEQEYLDLFYGESNPNDPTNKSPKGAEWAFSNLKKLYPKQISVTEYNVEYGVQGNCDDDGEIFNQQKLKSALAMALYNNALLRQGIYSANHFYLSQYIKDTTDDIDLISKSNWLTIYQSQGNFQTDFTPTYYTLMLYSNAKGKLLSTSTSEEPTQAKKDLMDTVVTQDENSNINIFITNPSANVTRLTSINIPDYYPLLNAQVYTLNSQNKGPEGLEDSNLYNTYPYDNSFGHRNPINKQVSIAESNITQTNNKFFVEVPAHSLVLVKISPDSQAPQGNIVINEGQGSTSNQQVNLTWDAQDDGTDQENLLYQFSNDQTNWTEPEKGIYFKNWRLSDGYGFKTVYLKITDNSGKSTIVDAMIEFKDSSLPPVNGFNDTTLYEQNTYSSNISISGNKADNVSAIFENNKIADFSALNWNLSFEPKIGKHDYYLNYIANNNQTITKKTIRIDRHILGDINGDERVDLLDVSILASVWGQENSGWPNLNPEYDNVINLLDVSILASKWTQ